MKISTIFFDMGKVLVHFDHTLAIRKFHEKSPYSTDEILDLASNDPASIQYELGQISTQDYFTHFKKLLKFSGTLEELQLAWCDIFTLLEKHIGIAQTLANYYPLSILSNTSEAHIEFLKSRHNFFDIFKGKIYSYEVGLMKPDPAIYQFASEQMQADPLECLFIDDLEPNILTPSQMGWQTIHLRPDVDLLTALRSYDLKGL